MATAIEVFQPQEASAPASAPMRAGRRSEALDVARLAAALAIIWIHAGLHSSTVLARFAVPFFTSVAVYFVADKASRQPLATWPRWVLGRVARLYLPFLAWSAVYLAFKLVKKTLVPEQPNDFGGWEMLIWGGAYHLWFLPFMLLASLAAFPVVSLAGRHWLLMFAAAAILACCPCPAFWPASDRARCVWDALPSALAGCAWGMLVFSPDANRCCRWIRASGKQAGLAAGIGMLVAAMAMLACLGRSNLWETAAGVGLALAAVNWPAMTFPPVLAALGRVSLGIYCVHLLFIKIGESVASKLRVTAGTELDLALFLLAAVASAACAWVLSRWRCTRWLVA